MTEIKKIVTGHGKFASGIKTTLELLGVKDSNLVFVDFTEEKSEEDLMNEYTDLLKGSNQTLFFTDLLGGTPFKAAATLSSSNDGVSVVTGCNVGSLIETSFNTYDSADQLADDLVNVSKNYTQKLDLSDLNTDNDDIEGDGI